MDYFYDGQIRRYVTQFMRVFIGFKYQAGDGEQLSVPVMYGDMSRQVANIIRENSENKMMNVPRIACYIGSLELATDRLSDPSFVSKVHIRERRYTDAGGTRDYQNTQGGNYTVERLMPTPFKLTMKADIWTSNTDQKLQLMEQILVLFNPSLELQTTDNYIDWTSLSSLYLTNTSFSSRTIPAGAESEIDIASLDFELPIWITPPAKVKKLGIVQNIIANVFGESGELLGLEDLVYNGKLGSFFSTDGNRYRVLLFKSNTGNLTDNIYDLTLVNPTAAVLSAGLAQKDYSNGEPVEWDAILEVQGGYQPGSDVWFKKPEGGEIIGTFVVNAIDRSILTITLDPDTFPANTNIVGVVETRGTIDAIIDPYKYNPLEVYGTHANIPLGMRFLMLDDINNSENVGGFINYPSNPADSTSTPYRGPLAWRSPSNDDSSWVNQDGTDPVISANSIVEWTGQEWAMIFEPVVADADTIIQNIRTGVKYRWTGTQWLKAFEGEYGPGDWNFKLI